MKKFLIVKTSSLGDIIQSFPAVSYLRNKVPDAQIDWVVEKPFVELIESYPGINAVLSIDSKRWRKGLMTSEYWPELFQFRKTLQSQTYDAVFDLQGNLKSGIITALAVSADKVGFGWPTVHEKANLLFTNRRFNPPKEGNICSDYLDVIKLFFNDSEPFAARQFLLKLLPMQEKEFIAVSAEIQQLSGLKVMVCPGSAWQNKQLTKEALVGFLQRLQNYLNCSFLFVWGSEAELQLAESLKSLFKDKALVMGRLPLPVLQNVMDCMDLVVAMDSLPLHLAGTTKARTFSVFGASLASKFKPQGPQHLTLQGSCPYGQVFIKRCSKLRSCKTGACIRAFTGEDVFNSFREQDGQITG
jgi:heptosyltransferase I